MNDTNILSREYLNIYLGIFSQPISLAFEYIPVTYNRTYTTNFNEMTEKKEIIATSASHESEQKTTTEDQMGEKSDVGEANTTKKEGSTSKSETEGISAKHDESKEAKSIITVDDSKKDTASTKSSDKYTPSTSDYHTQTASIEDTKTKSTKVDKKVVAVKENTKKSNRKSLFDSDSEVSSIGFGESSDSGSNSSSDSDSSEDEKNQSKKRKEKEKKKSKTKVKREGKNSSKASSDEMIFVL